MRRISRNISLILYVVIGLSACGGSSSPESTSPPPPPPPPVDVTPPVITLLADNPQTVIVGSDYVELGATATDDVDGDISASIVIDAGAVDTNTVGTYAVTYDVSDASGNAAATVSRTVSVEDPLPVNNPPNSNAGIDQTVFENATVQLAGQGSDPDGDSLTYAWSQQSGPTVTILSASALDATFVAPMVAIGTTEDVVLSLMVTDSSGASTTDEVTVNIESNDFILFLVQSEDGQYEELYKYDTRGDLISKLSGNLVAGGTVVEFLMSPNGQYVAYVADQDTDNQNELYVAAVDASSINKINGPITNPAGTLQAFQWSPDSTQIVYLADAEVDGVSEVYLADRDGANLRKISGDTSGAVTRQTDISWSPDGRYIAQRVSENGGLFGLRLEVYDSFAASPSSVRITPTDPAASSVTGIAGYSWSSNSEYIMYVGDMEAAFRFEIYTLRPDGSDHMKVNVPLSSSGTVYALHWAPDASRIAYLADTIATNTVGLYTVLPDGADNTLISSPESVDGDVYEVTWAPDSSRIAYRGPQDSPPMVELYTVLPDGSNKVKINAPMLADGNVDEFAWSADSANVAYVADANVDETFEVFIGDGSTENTVQISGPLVAPTDASFVQSHDSWASSDSKLLYLVSTNGTDNKLYSTDASGLNRIQIAAAAPGSGIGSSGGWSQDGSRIAYVGWQDVSGVAHLYLVGPDGANNANVSGLLLPNRSAGQFAWSP